KAADSRSCPDGRWVFWLRNSVTKIMNATRITSAQTIAIGIRRRCFSPVSIPQWWQYRAVSLISWPHRVQVCSPDAGAPSPDGGLAACGGFGELVLPALF